MDGRALITRVVLENYKSIAFCDVKLGPLSILVGPNGAGKSNFLDALRFLSEAHISVAKAFDHREGFGRVIRRSDPPSTGVGFRVEFITEDGTPGHYSVRLRKDEKEGYVNEKEHCAVGTGSGDSYLVVEGVASDGRELAPGSLYLPIMAGDPKFGSVSKLLDGFRFYKPNPEKLVQQVSDAVSNRDLFDDGSNLANVVNYLRLRQSLEPNAPPVLARIIQYLQAVNPHITAVKSEAFGGSRHLQFFLTGSADEFYPQQMSEGTLRSLAILVALFLPSLTDRVSLIGLEEPETALHPAAAGVLFDAMREASARVQVIATTHSADLLDKKEIDTDSILSVELANGTTRMGRLDRTGRQALKQELYTPGELMRMNYLRPESLKIPDDSEIESELFRDA